MDRMIRYRLEQLARRLRSQVFVGLLIVYWILLLSMFALVWKQGGAEVGVQLPKYLIFAFFALGALVLYLWSRFGYRDMKSIAECIEKRHPELDQKLLTAIEPPKPNESEFLRRKLVEETLAHAQKKDWEQIVPSGRLAALWGVQWLLLLVALSIPLMIAGKKTSNGESAGVKADKLDDWLIEPGDIQLEKGSDLLISVRFPDSFTDDLNMVATGPDGQSQVIRLQRSLKDPIASATLRRVKDSLRYRIESESKSSEMFNVEVFEHPGVVHSGALIQSPAYAKQEDKTISNTRRVSVVDGANIIWSLKLNKPVATAQWIDENGLETSLEPESDDPTAFRIASSPKGSGRYRLRLVDAQGRTEKGAEEFIVKVIPNREPELQLISASDQRVSPIQEMLVDAKVQDDFGIHRAGISVFVGDSEAQEIELKSSSNESSKKTELHHLIDLESLSAKADQLVTYHFWSEDLDRDGQPRRIDSEMFFAEVRPFEELFREGDSSATQQRQQQQEQQQQGSQGAQQAEELAELQKKIIAATWNLIRGLSNPSDDKLQAQMEKINVIRESQEQAIEQSEQLKQNLQSPESEQELFKVQTSMKDAVGELNSITADKTTVGLRNALKPMRAAYEGLLRLRAREHEVTQNQQQQSSSQRSQSSSQRNRQQQIQQLQLEQDPSRYEDESQPTRQEAQAEKEMRQVMNRLDELARRQQDLNEQVREIDLALQAAKDEQEKNDLRDRLDRLREEQKELVQDADELLERMNNPDTRNALEESRRQIENAREQMQQSEQQLSNSEPSAALNSGTRAQQDVEETRQKLREESSEALERDVQRLVQQAQEVSDKQTQLRRGLQEQSGSPPGDEAGSEKSVQNNQKGKESLLRSDTELSQDVDAEKRNIDAWKDQKKDYLELLDRIKETVEQAEGSEPLLAEQLYETYREASRLPTEQRLERIPMMIERGMDQPAIEEAQEVARDLQSLKDRIEESSQSVLGSEEDSLRRAIQELETANRAINEELAQRDPGPQTRNEQSDSREGQPREGQPREGQPREGQLQQSRPDAGVQTDSAQQEPSPVGQGAGQRAGQRERAPGQRGEARSVLEQLEERMTRAGGRGGIEASAPLMGEDYAQWTDRLRDIEELVRDPDLKAEAARVREAARDFRMEYKRHSKEPQWDLVKKMISNPLQELQRKVQEELVRKTAKQNELVPLDRDPVPERFRSELDLYFERLGGEQTK